MDTQHDAPSWNYLLKKWLAKLRHILLYLIVIVYIAIRLNSVLTVDYPSCVEHIDAGMITIVCR